MFAVSFSISIQRKLGSFINLNLQITLKNRVLSFPMIDTVPPPTNLKITDVTTESFRATWDHAASDVSLYRITWAPVGSSEKMEVVLTLFLFSPFPSLKKSPIYFRRSCLKYVIPLLPEKGPFLLVTFELMM